MYMCKLRNRKTDLIYWELVITKVPITVAVLLLRIGNLTIRTSMLMLNYLSGCEINFFLLIATWLLNFQSGSQFKISWSPFSKTNKTFCFFYAVSVLNRPSKIRLGKGLSYYKVDIRNDDIQLSSSPKSKMVSLYWLRCMCCVLETNLTRKFAADLSLQIFLIHYISR